MYRGSAEKPHSFKHKRISLLTGCAAVAFALPAVALAQDAVKLDEVVVTAGGFEQLLKDAPASVSVLTSEELERGAFANLTDALKEVQGVTVTGIAKERDIQIRGLPGSYTLILIDGRRQNTRDARPNGSSGYEQSFIPPLGAIDRIEVVRGPMSSLYGSDAMGGVINIITKKANQEWSGSVTLEGTAQQHSEIGNSQQLSFNLSGPVIKDRLSLQIWGRGLKREEDRIADGSQGETDRNLTTRLTYTPSADHDLWAEAGRSTVTGVQHEGASLAVNPAAVDDNVKDYSRKWWALGHTGRWGNATTDLSFQVEDGKRETVQWDEATSRFAPLLRAPKVRNEVLDGKITLPVEFRGQHTITAGFQWMLTTLVDQGDAPPAMTMKAKQTALFLEDEWKLTETFAVTGGLRLNTHETYGNHFTPRLYGVWQANPNLTIKGGVSTGFKAPDIRSIAPGYYLATQRGAGLIASNQDLKPETSTSLELSALWDNQAGLSFGATAFHTKFSDKISNANSHRMINPTTGDIIDPLGGASCDAAAIRPYAGYKCLWQAFNIDNAVIQGIELNANWAATQTVTLRGSYTYTDSQQKSGAYAGYPLTRTPKHRASLRADWITPVEGLDAWAAASYQGTEINAGARIGTNGSDISGGSGLGVRKYGAFTTLDMGASYRVNDRVTVNGAVYNLLDKRTDATEYNAVGEGRRLWLGVTTAF